MSVRRGDVVLAYYPFASGVGGSRRPDLVVQSDRYNHQIRNTIIAQITTNLRRASDPAYLLIEVATPEGAHAGLLHDSVISCINLATVTDDRIDRLIGRLPDSLMLEVDACLQVAIGFP